MNIAQALKQKNRYLTRLTEIQEAISENNVVRSDNIDQPVSVGPLLEEHRTTMVSLCKVRAAISKASVGVQYQIAEMTALRSYLGFLSTLNTNGNPVAGGYGVASVPVKVTITTKQKTTMMSETQERINHLQDEIDDYNARTQVNIWLV